MQVSCLRMRLTNASFLHHVTTSKLRHAYSSSQEMLSREGKQPDTRNRHLEGCLTSLYFPSSFIMDIKCWSLCYVIFSLFLMGFGSVFCSSSQSSSEGLTLYFPSSSCLSFYSLLEQPSVYMLSSLSFFFLSHTNWCFHPFVAVYRG